MVVGQLLLMPLKKGHADVIRSVLPTFVSCACFGGRRPLHARLETRPPCHAIFRKAHRCPKLRLLPVWPSWAACSTLCCSTLKDVSQTRWTHRQLSKVVPTR